MFSISIDVYNHTGNHDEVDWHCFIFMKSAVSLRPVNTCRPIRPRTALPLVHPENIVCQMTVVLFRAESIKYARTDKREVNEPQHIIHLCKWRVDVQHRGRDQHIYLSLDFILTFSNARNVILVLGWVKLCLVISFFPFQHTFITQIDHYFLVDLIGKWQVALTFVYRLLSCRVSR